MIGIFGGTFNPIHIGHLILAENALTELKLEKVVFVPSVGSPSWYKDNPMVSFMDRHTMVMQSIIYRDKFDISEIAAECGDVTYTVDVLSKLSFPKDKIVLLMGPDAYSTFWEWNNYEDILLMCNSIAVAGRDFFMSEIGVRSSDIREFVKNGRSIRYLVPDMALDYIMKKGLYKE